MSHIPDEQLNLYLDHVLDPVDQVLVETHLRDCETCQAALTRHKQLFRLFAELPSEPIPADLVPLVLAGIAAPQNNPGKPVQTRWPVQAWAILVVQLMLVVALAAWSLPFIQAPLAAIQPERYIIVLQRFWVEVDIMMQGGMLHLQAMLNSPIPFALPLFNPLEWFVLFAAALALWLVGNRYLLALPGSAQSGQQEVGS
jgi:predicted anti-sigma-YlaC factor YlaD